MRAFSSPSALLLCLTVAAQSGQDSPVGPWIVDLDQLASAVREQWSYLEDRTGRGDVDLDVLLACAREEAGSAREPREFVAIVERLVAGLHDGHASVAAAEPEIRFFRLPFEVLEAKEGILVSRVLAPVDGVADGPLQGERWVALGELSMEELLLGEERRCFGSTLAGRRANALERALQTNATELECTFEDAEGKRRTVQLRTLGPGEAPGSPEESWVLRWPREDVALLRIASFAVADWQGWLAAAPEEREVFLADTKERVTELFGEIAARSPRALILDVRGNGGGTDLLGIHLAEHLIEGRFHYFLLSARFDGKWMKPAGLPYGVDVEWKCYRGPVIALIDSDCFSTTDNFLRCLDDLHPDFTTIGRPTGGGTGAPRSIVRLENSGIEVRLCTQRVYGPKGELIEGRGTVPDVPIEWSRADLVSGQDPDLAAALARVDALPRER